MDDMVLVSRFLYETPCLEFCGRYGTTDMTGEKLSQQIVQPILNRIGERYAISPLSLVGVEKVDVPYYCLIAEGDSNERSAITQILEEELNKVHHYRLARELGQLRQAQVIIGSRILEEYTSAQMSEQTLAGAFKIDTVALWRDPQEPEIRLQ